MIVGRNNGFARADARAAALASVTAYREAVAEWLSRHRVTAAIHPPEGEESPVRRRQDQSPSHDQRREGRTETTRGRGTPWLT